MSGNDLLAYLDGDPRTRVIALPHTPVIATFPGVEQAPAQLSAEDGESTIPFFEVPETAIRALGTVAAYPAWRTAPRPVAVARPVPSTRDRARAVLLEATRPAGRLRR